MCGYFYSHNVPNWYQNLESLDRRGPENTSWFDRDNEQFYHSLLNTKGPVVKQPISNDHGTLLYNGSTYNSEGNDTQWIVQNLDANLENTIDLIKGLRGEYSLTYVTDSHIVFCVDQWETKNLYFYYNQEEKKFLIASTINVILDNAPDAVKVFGNTIYIIDKHNFELTSLTTTDWNFTQKYHNYDTIHEYFEQSVKLRHEQDITTYLLSSGHDSGVIVCCANKLLKHVNTVSQMGREHEITMQKRLVLQNKPKVQLANSVASDETVLEIYKHHPIESVKSQTAKMISGIIELHFLKQKQKILISGIGGDELYSDYIKDKKSRGRVGRMNGKWPHDLRTIYPWHNYENTRLRYQLQRSDSVCGHYGVEARYPLLDQQVFQAWLNLSYNLRNRGYKDWMSQYMKDHNYPMQSQKIGFGA